MPINSFAGETYVAFSDLNGFKEMMRNHERAAKALDTLYKSVYELKTKHEYSKIQTLAISDCNQFYKQFEQQDRVVLDAKVSQRIAWQYDTG